jgi:ZIP family zinc transporter
MNRTAFLKPANPGSGRQEKPEEPIAAAVTIVAAGTVVPIMPYLLAFAAGAMMYVVVEELIPEMSEGKHSNLGTIAFALGFVLMMVLDVTLG